MLLTLACTTNSQCLPRKWRHLLCSVLYPILPHLCKKWEFFPQNVCDSGSSRIGELRENFIFPLRRANLTLIPFHIQSAYDTLATMKWKYILKLFQTTQTCAISFWVSIVHYMSYIFPASRLVEDNFYTGSTCRSHMNMSMIHRQRNIENCPVFVVSYAYGIGTMIVVQSTAQVKTPSFLESYKSFVLFLLKSVDQVPVDS